MMFLIGLLLMSAALFLVWIRNRSLVFKRGVPSPRMAALQWLGVGFWAAGCIVFAIVHWFLGVASAGLSLLVWRIMESLTHDRAIANELYDMFEHESVGLRGDPSALFRGILKARYPSIPPEVLEDILEKSADFEDIVAHAIGYERSNGNPADADHEVG